MGITLGESSSMGGKLDETLMLLQSAGVLPIIRAKNTDAGAQLTWILCKTCESTAVDGYP